MLMEVLEFLKELLAPKGIEYVSALPLSNCRIIKPYLLEREGISKGTAIMLAAPYHLSCCGKSNISKYAFSEDYHRYFGELFESLLPPLREAFPKNRFAGFSDHSPIDEVDAAAKCGLGIIGENRLLINEKYSSFVFLGEIICDIPFEGEAGKAKHCEGCGICKKSCPVGLEPSLCLSSLSQKKGQLTEDERKLLLDGGSAWGCDICQLNCPHSKNIEETKVDFFRKGHLSYVSSDIISHMSEEDFSRRAYSWRGRDVILRNLRIFESKEK